VAALTHVLTRGDAHPEVEQRDLVGQDVDGLVPFPLLDSIGAVSSA
jgi:hypothetical protein